MIRKAVNMMRAAKRLRGESGSGGPAVIVSVRQANDTMITQNITTAQDSQIAGLARRIYGFQNGFVPRL